jgi:predicted small lipoprotein YifL
MKTLSLCIVTMSTFALMLSGCGSPGPSPEEVTREQKRQQEEAKAQANFFKESPPPASQPGR